VGARVCVGEGGGGGGGGGGADTVQGRRKQFWIGTGTAKGSA